MARRNPPGQLSRAPDKVEFAFATPADEADLRRLLRETPMQGAIRVGFTHEPDYFAGTGLAGADDRTLLARESGRLVGAGRCTTRPAWLNGEVRRVAYLGELRLAPEVQGRWDILRGGYAFFTAAYARDPADFCYTSIIADNTRARRLLERGARGLPRYQFIGEHVTLLLPVATSPVPAKFTVTTGADLPAETLAGFLNAAARDRQLAAHWTPDRLRSLAAHGLRPEDFIVLRQGAEIAACAGVWDQHAFRQILVTGYSPLLAATRPGYNLLAPLLGQPRLPPADSFVRQAFLSPWACRPGDVVARSALIQSARATAARRGLDCLTLGGTPDDAALQVLRGRRYLSRLYRVDWPGQERRGCELDARPCLPDISLL